MGRNPRKNAYRTQGHHNAEKLAAKLAANFFLDGLESFPWLRQYIHASKVGRMH